MRLEAVTVAAFAAEALAVLNPHKRALKHQRPERRAPVPHLSTRQSSPASEYLNNNTKQYVVDGANLPNVTFDAGESYAGRMSISDNPDDENALFFWFWPSDNVNATDEITIWLNGGPGCSSLDGFFQENGPFLWQSGTYSPQPNPFSWTNLTNMVWVDQPIGAGLSGNATGAPAGVTNETVVGADFAGFWKNFMTAFNMTGRKVYIAGESYAGMYVPYIAQYMLEQNNTDYYNVQGIQINDPSIGLDAVVTEAPAVTHMNNYLNVFALNDSFVENVNQRAESCGYFEFMEQALTFPPTGKFMNVPNETASGCAVWDDIIQAAIYVNPCFNFYHLTDFCPFLWDVMGFPSLGAGPNNYFGQADVQKALNVPNYTNYAVCGDDSLGLRNPGDTSEPSSFTALPYVIDTVVPKGGRVVVGSGLLDFLLLTNGTLATLNNMTWGGSQGFSSYPNGSFFVPYNPSLGPVIFETFTQSDIPSVPVGLTGGGGILGKTITERGLTFVTVDLSGHEIPQYVPTAAYRQLEFLLGRIDSLTEIVDSFTTQSGNFSGTQPPSPYYPTSSSGGSMSMSMTSSSATASMTNFLRRARRAIL